jgi:glycosyltransferase involved in cell wall biosynthesis
VCAMRDELPHLKLNMIVKNEAAHITRCLDSVIPYIASAAIVDTGSTDGTQDIITGYLDKAKIPVEIKFAPFLNWSQARNTALDFARERNGWDYLLLCDADMELIVPDREAFFKEISRGLRSYDMEQRVGGVVGGVNYLNRRLVSRKSKAIYLGVTHEYLDEGEATSIRGPYFLDHADGSNRPDKLKRDVELLEEALKTEPNNVRYWFYLAQSYRDLGEHNKAAIAYTRRIELGGWDQEVWNAHYNYAHCLDNQGDEKGFIYEMLLAYGRRPSRAESLYDLASHFLKKGKNAVATHFALAAMQVPYPKDSLFISDYAYKFGAREVLAIAGFYQPETYERGFRECDSLALDRAAPLMTVENARANLFHYLKPLLAHVRHCTMWRIPFTPPDGYTAMNPTIIRDPQGTGFIGVVRTVNYTISDEGNYLIRGDDNISPHAPIHTRNFLLRFDDTWRVVSSKEIHEPVDMPEPQFNLVRGFEDMRLFPDANRGLRFSACVREMNPEGACEQVHGSIREIQDEEGNLSRAEIRRPRKVEPWQRQHEKNWMPWRASTWMYRLGTVIDSDGNKVSEHVPQLATDHISGGTQLIPVDAGYLAVVHEARPNPFNGKRYYQHRFAQFHDGGKLIGLSRPFVFQDRQIEFAMGMVRTWDGSVVVSFGVRDCEAWLVRLRLDEIRAFIDDWPPK